MTFTTRLLSLLTILFIGFAQPAQACSPCGGITVVNMNVVGTDLVMDLQGSPGWSCQYTMMIEIVCANTNFTNTATHSTTSINAASYGSPYNNIPFPTITIDISSYCPGTYDIQAWMNTCQSQSSTVLPSFTIPGSTGINLTATAVPDTICLGETTQLNATANGGCQGGAISYQWQGAGVSNMFAQNPTATPPVSGTITYTVTATAACVNESVTVDVVVLEATPVTATSVDDICSTSIGEVSATPDPNGTPGYTYYWPPPIGANGQTITGVPTGLYTVEMTDGNGCVSTDQVNVGDTPADFQGSTTLVSCPGGSDGTAFAEMVPPLGNISYQWDANAGNQVTQTATGLSAGPYSCTITSDIGCQGVVDVIVSEIPGMVGNVIAQTDVTCNSGSDGMLMITVAQGTGPYTYAWDNSTSDSTSAHDLPAGQNICTVTDDNGCTYDIIGNLGEPAPLDITYITPNTQICPEHEIQLEAIGSGGSSQYFFDWYENGALIDTGAIITVDPDFTNTEYCVILSELCGSPEDKACTLIYFPTPIEPSAVPDQPEKCVPDVFEFYHTSTNAGEIASTFWEFDLNPTHTAIELADDSTSWYYTNVGTYDVIMTVTSIYGCVYTDTMFNIIKVLPVPVANFGFSSNPTTIFETNGIQLQDKSSYDVVEWQYYSPFSIPTSSTDPNPLFDFPEGIVAEYPVTLIVTTELGCVDSVTLYMNIIDDVTFFAPNSFTPDGDELNQVWRPYVNGIDIYNFDLFIFDRWGEVIWESHDPSAGWDGTYNGKIMQAGTYTWRAKVKKPHNDDSIIFSGFINILK